MTKIKDVSPDISITVAIPVKNEEANLAKCLDRLTRFKEVVVIDSDSDDRTQEIALEYGARVVNFKWDGKYPKKRNWFLLNEPPTQPWVLFLDADEFVDDDVCDELKSVSETKNKAGYWLYYNNYFMGQPLKHGLAQRKLAFFRVGAGLYERLDEDFWSSLDMEIHEHPILEGEIGEIINRIDHKDLRGLDRFISKHNEYAQWEARRFFQMKGHPEKWSHFTPRQKFKYSHLTKFWYPGFYFLYTYIVKLGFLDGSTGFHYAYYKAWYFHTIRLLIREQEQVQPNNHS